MRRAPDELDDAGKKEFYRVLKQLKKHQIYEDDIDSVSLLGYCVCYSILVKGLKEFKDVDSLIMKIETKTGGEYSQEIPIVSSLLKTLKTLKDYAKTLGLTFHARKLIKKPIANDIDDDDSNDGILDF